MKLEDEGLRAAMLTGMGRAMLWEVIVESGAMDASFVAGDQHATAYNEGRRSVGLDLMRRMEESSPELYMRAFLERLKALELARLEKEEELKGIG